MRRSDSLTNSSPSATAAASHRLRCCSASTTTSPAAYVRAVRRDSVNSNRAGTAVGVASSGISSWISRANRIASAHPSTSTTAAPPSGACPAVEMRQNALPILEDAGVDLVLTGHSHSYERSYLIDGHYGTSSSFTQAMKVDGGNGRELGDGAYQKPGGLATHAGAVYAVAGSSGKISGGTLNHPAMVVSLNSLGSMVLDVFDGRLDAVFLDATGVTRDIFTILKGGAVPQPPPRADRTDGQRLGHQHHSGLDRPRRQRGWLPRRARPGQRQLRRPPHDARAPMRAGWSTAGWRPARPTAIASRRSTRTAARPTRTRRQRRRRRRRGGRALGPDRDGTRRPRSSTWRGLTTPTTRPASKCSARPTAPPSRPSPRSGPNATALRQHRPVEEQAVLLPGAGRANRHADGLSTYSNTASAQTPKR